MYTPSHLCSLSLSANQWSSACSNSCPVAITLTQHCAMITMDQNRQECYMTAVILHNGQSPSAACVKLIRKWCARAVHPTCCMLHICSTFMAFFACICFVLRLLTVFCFMARTRDMRTFAGLYVAFIYIPDKVVRLMACACCCFMMTPGAKWFLALLTVTAQGCPGPFWAPFLARLCHCKAAGRFCFVHDARRTCQNTTIYRRSAQHSRSQVHVCLHALLVPVFLECAWTLRFSPLLFFTFHKAVSTCLSQVLLTIHTCHRA